MHNNGFRRTVSNRRTHHGVPYVHIQWWSGRVDVVIGSVEFKNLTAKEELFICHNAPSLLKGGGLSDGALRLQQGR